ncbi:MAG: efflux transporter outer membrane subunit [Sulfuricaulis sp.]
MARGLSLALSMLVLSGCASVEMPSLATPVPDRWRNAPVPVAEARPPTDLHGWWHEFNDARLDALVDHALRANLDVAQAREHLIAARILYNHANAPFLPSLRARTNDAVDPDASASFINAGFDATWELGLFGRAAGATREARGQLEAAAADFHAVRVSLVAEVVRNWIDLRSAQHREQWLSAVRDNRQQHFDLLETRAKLGLANPQEVLQARADRAEAEAALSAPRQDAMAAAQRLAVLTGRNDPDPDWLTPGPLPELGALKFAGAPAELLRTRPEIARAEADVVRVAGELGVARADMYPNIGLGASIVWSTNIATNRRHPTTNVISAVGPLIDIPLFDWGMRAARSDSKAHELKAAVLAYRQAVIAGVADVEMALGTLEQQRRREDASIEAWQALTQSAQAEDTRKRLGLSGGIERNQALIARDQAALAVVDARAARDVAYVGLYKALGGAPEPLTDMTASSEPAGVVR